MSVSLSDSAGGVVTWEHLPVVTAVSPLWDESVRGEVTKTKMTEQEMHRRRAQLLVPGGQGTISKSEGGRLVSKFIWTWFSVV